MPREGNGKGKDIFDSIIRKDNYIARIPFQSLHRCGHFFCLPNPSEAGNGEIESLLYAISVRGVYTALPAITNQRQVERRALSVLRCRKVGTMDVEKKVGATPNCDSRPHESHPSNADTPIRGRQKLTTGGRGRNPAGELKPLAARGRMSVWAKNY